MVSKFTMIGNPFKEAPATHRLRAPNFKKKGKQELYEAIVTMY